MAEYEDAGNYGESEPEVPPAPWQYSSDADGEGSGSGSYSGSSGGGEESTAAYGDNPELAYSQNWNSGADYNPYPAQDYSSEKLGSDPELAYYGAYQPGSPYYDVPEFQAGDAPAGISQGEGWKIMRDQYNEAGLGAGGTAPEPPNRWQAATLPNLLAWGAGYGNAMGQTPQQMTRWINQSIKQWNSAHPEDQYPLLQPAAGPRVPTPPRGGGGGGGGYGPRGDMTPEEYIRYLENRLKYGGLLRL